MIARNGIIVILFIRGFVRFLMLDTFFIEKLIFENNAVLEMKYKLPSFHQAGSHTQQARQI